MTLIRFSLLALASTALLAQEPEGPSSSKAKPTKGQLSVNEFATTGSNGSSVGITMDDQGRVYVCDTRRRNNAEIDIRKNKDWLLESLALTSPEQRIALIKRRMPDTWQKLANYKERILCLEDTDGDGRVDKRTVAFEGFNAVGDGLAGGLLWHKGALYVTIMPSLWKLTDQDNDGVFETKQELVRGIGYHIGYGGHDMHGPTLGLDGRIYWTTGDKGIHVQLRDGQDIHLPGQGGCFRIEPDGSGFEVFAHGLRNSQELAFNERGDLFTVDNDGDFGDKERAVHIVEGSDSGWRAHYQYRSDRSWAAMLGYNPWLADNLWKPRESGLYQPAYLLSPMANLSVGPIGFEFNPGTAMSEAWRGVFFLAESSKSIMALRFATKGAGFEVASNEQVLSGPFITGLFFGTDGSLYGADWGDNPWAPHEKGRVLKLDAKDRVLGSERAEVQTLLRDGMSKREPAALQALLGHADQRIRLRAQLELAKRGDASSLFANTSDPRPLGRLHAVWGLGQLARRGIDTKLASLLTHDDAEVRAQAARMLGDAKVLSARAEVAKLLSDPEPRTRAAAGIALRKLGGAQVEAIAMLEANNDADLVLRHAGAMALPLPAEVVKHPSKAVRLAAVVSACLRSDAAAALFLKDSDLAIVSEAARAIHDDLSIHSAMSALAEALDDPRLVEEGTLRRAISANIRVAGDAQAERLMRYALRKEAPAAMRAEALETLVLWPTGLAFDRVVGFHRGLPANDAARAKALFAQSFDALISDAQEGVRLAAAKLVRALDYREAIAKLTPLALDAAQPISTRAVAVHTLAVANADRAKEVIEALAKDPAPELRIAALKGLAQLEPKQDSTFKKIDDVIRKGSLAEQQSAFALLASVNSGEAERVIKRWADNLVQGKAAPEIALDIYEAAASTKALKKSVSAIDAALKKQKHTAWSYALTGGDAAEGKAIFTGSTTAACMQCHPSMQGVPSVGPDLSKVAERLTPEKLLLAVIDPQKEIAEGYGLINATMKDGSIVSGLLAKESKTELILRVPATPITNTVAKADVATRSKPASAMPVMTSLLTKHEVRDLVAYLRTLK